jgi:two-component system, cell cycle sensor histidine kinase and response regulator CckA
MAASKRSFNVKGPAQAPDPNRVSTPMRIASLVFLLLIASVQHTLAQNDAPPPLPWAAEGGYPPFLLASSEGLLLLENSVESQRIYDKRMGVHEERSNRIADVLRHAALIAAPLILLAMASFLWSWSLRKKVALKTGELRSNEAKLKSILNAAPIGIGLVVDRVIVDVNERLTEMLGRSREELTGKNSRILYPAQEEYDFVGKEKYRQLRDRGTGTVQTRFRRKDGGIIDILLSSSPIDPNNLSAGVTFTALDITDRNLAEKAVRHSNDLMRYIIEHANSAVAVHDRDLRYVYVSQRYLTEYGVKESDIIGRHHYDVFPDLPQKWREVHQRALAGEVLGSERDNYVRKDGTIEWTRWDCRPWHGEDGSIAGIIVYTQVITDQVLAEEQLRQSEQRFSKAFQSNPAPMVISEIDTGRFIDTNEQWLMMLGYTKEQTIGRSSLDMGIWADPGERDRVISELRTNRSVRDAAVRFVDRAGQIKHALWSAEAITLGGREVMLSLILDITARKQAEQEREKLQAQLTQAQKMEAVGRLAGGVAHDFNNMLSIINGYAELALLDLQPNSPLKPKIEAILTAGHRSAEIVRQLLAFARKQTITPQVLDLNETLAEMLKMLRSIIGENIHLAWMPGDGLWKVRMDPTQLQQMLANLAINARDAIADVGRVTIETSNVALDREHGEMHPETAPGDYVVLAVSDNGSGMDQETQSRLFEPFFTTKEPGRGTGLGLATVYGIVSQNEGFITVSSVPGKGTGFRVHLPRHKAEAEEQLPKPSAEMPFGGETILLVEDKPMVLHLCTEMLGSLGYAVLAASTPAEALRLAREHQGEIHLLLTDVIMPEMNGRDLRDRIVALRPGIKCLFMSGYTADVIASHGVLDDGIDFIEKPFTKMDLAILVHKVLRAKTAA